MAEIQPFRGVRYNTEKVATADVLTQPYDKITAAMRERYLRQSPFNLIRIELGQEQPGDSDSANKYTRARDLYQAWLRDGILRRAQQPAIYFLEQTFAAPDGSGQRTRKALIARVRLSRWDEGHVLPHEHTLSKPKADRLSLLRACGSQQGQIFMLYPDSIPSVPVSASPSIECVDDYQVLNRLWEISDPAIIGKAQAALRNQKFYIADGHHRYETALAFRDELNAGPDAPSAFVMATLVDMNDPGLIVLPTHRVVSRLAHYDPHEVRRRLAEHFVIEKPEGDKRSPHTIGMGDALGCAALRLKNPDAIKPLFADKPPLWHTLDVAILHVAILERLLGIDEQKLRDESNVTYYRESDQALAQLHEGAQAVFFLAPTPVSDVKAIADARSRMPQKSTDFYPKLLSGLVNYEVRPEAGGA